MKNETLPKILLRADASLAIGTGHVMRCLALAQAWRDMGGEVVFLFGQAVPALEQRIKREGMAVEIRPTVRGTDLDAEETAQAAFDNNAAYVVLDGYCYGEEYQRIIKQAKLPLLIVDDNGENGVYHADIILNQNLHATEKMYLHRSEEAILLLGTRYAMLRREFRQRRQGVRANPITAKNILVTLGGGDKENLTARVIRVLERIPFSTNIKVIVGAANPHYDMLCSLTEKSPINISIEQNVEDMFSCMAWADVAVACAGSTSLELLATELPAALFVIAQNQELLAKQLQHENAAIVLGEPSQITDDKIINALQLLIQNPRLREQLSERCRSLVDGHGAERVAKRIYCELQGISIRRVLKSDCQLLWTWANDPIVRANAFSSGPISFASHRNWMSEGLENPNRYHYLLSNTEGSPIGQVRFDFQGDEAVIDISIDASYRGKGYASRILKLALKTLQNETTFRQINAYIKPENSASKATFAAAGFTCLGTTTISSQECKHYIWRPR